MSVSVRSLNCGSAFGQPIGQPNRGQPLNSRFGRRMFPQVRLWNADSIPFSREATISGTRLTVTLNLQWPVRSRSCNADLNRMYLSRAWGCQKICNTPQDWHLRRCHAEHHNHSGSFDLMIVSNRDEHLQSGWPSKYQSVRTAEAVGRLVPYRALWTWAWLHSLFFAKSSSARNFNDRNLLGGHLKEPIQLASFERQRLTHPSLWKGGKAGNQWGVEAAIIEIKYGNGNARFQVVGIWWDSTCTSTIPICTKGMKLGQVAVRVLAHVPDALLTARSRLRESWDRMWRWRISDPSDL